MQTASLEVDEMTKRISELPAVLTCFAYRREYFAEMEGMLETVRLHHPQWPVVVGRGPVEGYGEQTIEVESPSGKSLWTLPVALNLDASENDWFKIVLIKGWWMSRVWHEYGDLIEAGPKRLIWLDADARLNGPLDIEIDSGDEVVAGPWWDEPEYFDGRGMIGSGLLLLQGARQAVVESIVDEWSSKCLNTFKQTPQGGAWVICDDDVLTEVLHSRIDSNEHFKLLKLERRKYHCLPIDGSLPTEAQKIIRRGLVDHWCVGDKMWFNESRDVNWPPSEEYRRAEFGTPIPMVSQKTSEEEPS
jgi:hypothetical protein